MHRVNTKTYAGAPSEIVTLTTDIHGGGQVTVTVDGVDIGAARDFPLKSNPGQRTDLQITMFGPNGATCVVGIATVDGGADGDLLICQDVIPPPSHFYSFQVAPAAAMMAFMKLTTAGGPQ